MQSKEGCEAAIHDMESKMKGYENSDGIRDVLSSPVDPGSWTTHNDRSLTLWSSCLEVENINYSDRDRILSDSVIPTKGRSNFVVIKGS